MKAIILAAGRGSRMHSLTDHQPKCLTELDGKTLLEWQKIALNAAGIVKIVVVAGYKSSLLKGTLEVLENKRWAETNMVRTLLAASEILKNNNVIISYSDIVYNSEHIKKLMDEPSDIAICYDQLWFELWALRFSNPLLDAETFEAKNGMLTDIGSKTDDVDRIKGQYMGLLKISPLGWKKISNVLQALPDETIDKLDMTSMLALLLKEKIDVNVVAVSGQWCEVDTPTDLKKYELALHTQDNWAHDWRG